MNKFLIFVLFSTLVFSQETPKYKMPVFPGCEKFETNDKLRVCLQESASFFAQSYFKSNKNIIEYFQFPSFKENATFLIDTKGKLIYKKSSKNSDMFALVATDLFRVLNVYLDQRNAAIQPAKTDSGPVGINFALPINYLPDSKIYLKDSINPIRFTLNSNQKFTVRQTKDFKFLVYNQNNELVETLNTFVDLVTNPLILESVTANKNVIVDKTIDDINLRIEIENLFSNISKPFKISVYKDNLLVEDFLSMDDFMSSEFSVYTY